MHNTRRANKAVNFDPEIEKTAKRLRKEFLQKQAEAALHLDTFFEEEEETMGDKTLKQLATPDVTSTPLSIVFPKLDKPLKLNSGFLNLLPKFHGMSYELPNMHLIAFDLTCSSMESEGVKLEDIKLRAFPFSLDGAAKEWLFYLPPSSITSWDSLKIAFLEKFQPASRVAVIRKEISGIRQNIDESLCEYWEKFNKLCASCPQHQITEQLLLFYFYEGLLTKDRCYIDAASGGMLADKTPSEARALINNMALNTQQFGSRRDKGEASSIYNGEFSSLKSQMDENAQQLATLTTLVSTLVSAKPKPTMYAVNSDHIYGNESGQPLVSENVNALGGYNNQNQRKYDPLSNTYNEGWKDNPNLRYGSGPRPQPAYQNNFRPYAPQPQSNSLEDMMKQLTTQVSQVQNQHTSYQQKTDSHLQQLDSQMAQICTSLSSIQTSLSGKPQALAIPNPKENTYALRLKKNNTKPWHVGPGIEVWERDVGEKLERPPLINCINVVPKFATLFEEFQDKNNLSVEEIRSEQDSSCPFHIPCGLGGLYNGNCLLDLGADINTMPLHVYNSHRFGPLTSTTSILELANGRCVLPIGVLKEVLVKIGNFEFKTDFYIMDSHSSFPILLGKPFLKTSRALIDVGMAEVMFQRKKEILRINFYDITRSPLILEDNVFNLEDYCSKVLAPEMLEELLDELVEEYGLNGLFQLAIEELKDI